GNSHLVVNQNALQMRVTIVLAGVMVMVVGVDRCKSLQPLVDIPDQPLLPVIYIDARRDLHSGNQHKALVNSGFLNECRHFISDTDVLATLLRVEPKVLSVSLHNPLLRVIMSAHYYFTR